MLVNRSTECQTTVTISVLILFVFYSFRFNTPQLRLSTNRDMKCGIFFTLAKTIFIKQTITPEIGEGFENYCLLLVDINIRQLCEEL